MRDQRFEDTVKNLSTDRPTELSDKLNKFARQGWQLCGTTEEEETGTKYYILERPVNQ
jgi:hypothetical protein